MKRIRKSLVLALVAVTWAFTIVAQERTGAAETASKLRQQLIELQSQETELRSRLQQLDTDLKPENIERALAGIGSTKPEELREHRRRQLTIERNGVLAQLKTLEESKSRLESAIATADTQAYQQSAGPISNQMIMVQPAAASRWPLVAIAGVVVILIGGGAILLLRKRRA